MASGEGGLRDASGESGQGERPPSPILPHQSAGAKPARRRLLLRLFWLTVRTNLVSFRSSHCLALSFISLFLFPYCYQPAADLVADYDVCPACFSDPHRVFLYLWIAGFLALTCGLLMPALLSHGWSREGTTDHCSQIYLRAGFSPSRTFQVLYFARFLSLAWVSGAVNTLAFVHYRRLEVRLPAEHFVTAYGLSLLLGGVSLALFFRLRLALRSTFIAYCSGFVMLTAFYVIAVFSPAIGWLDPISVISPFHHLLFVTTSFAFDPLRTGCSALILLTYQTLLVVLCLRRLEREANWAKDSA